MENLAGPINIINIVCTPFSLMGCVYLLYYNFRSFKFSFSSKLVFCLAISDLLLTLVDVMEIFNLGGQNCVFQGFIRMTGIYSNMLWTAEILMVLYFQFVHEFAGIHRTFPYLVAANIVVSFGPCTAALIYQFMDGTNGPIYFTSTNGECFIAPETIYPYVLIIPFAIILTLCFYMTIRVYMVIKEQHTTLANVDYKTLFFYPAVLFLFDVPISIDFITKHQFSYLTLFCMVLFKSVGFVNALQFRKANNVKEKLLRESQQEVILRTLTQDGENSFN